MMSGGVISAESAKMTMMAIFLFFLSHAEVMMPIDANNRIRSGS